MILAYLDFLFILYSFLPQPLPCNNIFDHIIETERTTTTRIKKKKIGSEMGIVNIEFTESLSALSFYTLDV